MKRLRVASTGGVDIVMTAFRRADAILNGNREILEQGARELLEWETQDKAALKELTKTLCREKKLPYYREAGER